MSTPYIGPEKRLPELTPKAIVLGLVLSVILGASNAYLGLFAGLTVAASIPAAVISMAVLKMFKKNNILENNQVQTAASAGETLAAGAIFTLPALVLMGAWDDFHYWQTTLIVLVGGLLGVLFSVPLHRALIVKQGLKYPEGVATAEVLKVGHGAGDGVKSLALAGLAGAAFKFIQSGMGVWYGILDKATLLGGRHYLYFGMNLSPALVSVGFIVGLNVAVLVFIGGAINWWIAIPAWIAANGPLPDVNPVDMGYIIWSKHTRYIGVGAMVVGGLWALISIRSAVGEALASGVAAFKKKTKSSARTPRTEQDMPMKWVMIGVGALLLPIFALYVYQTQDFTVALVMALIMVGMGFLFTSVATYMAGLVGTSNNPVSGLTIATLLFSSLILLAFWGTGSVKGPASAILIAGVVCSACALGGDNCQDLKAGHILGATPRKQQIMQVLGVVSAAFFMAPVLSLLNKAYGFGPRTAEFPNALPAPQATLMQGVSTGVFGGSLPWNLLLIGAVIGVIIILIDLQLAERKSKFRMPVLAVAIGIYLPYEMGSAICLGGILSWLVSRATANRTKAVQEKAQHGGVLIASGLITGEALVGIGLAIPIAIVGRNDIFKVISTPLGMWPGCIALGLLAYWLYKGSVSSVSKR